MDEKNLWQVAEELFSQTNNGSQAERKSSGEMPACFKIALRVPSGMSPEWLGIVV
jgi:hypothetical protein